jgi:glycosyltransferase involved in cell wall biosynthesis
LRENISKIFKVNKEGISVVPNSIACDKAVKEDSNFKNQDKVTLLYVGRIERGKGIYTLAEAFLEVTKICKDKVKCVFIGDICPQYGGPSPQKTLIQFFTENNILQYVEFKGEVSEEELFTAYNMCDIFINPSLIYESFSYTCLEAMLCAKPVVASKIGGIPEVVSEGETGFLFEPGRKEELAEKLKLLIDDSQKRKSMGQAGRERVKNKFSSEEVAKQNIELYQKICKI